MAGHKPLKRVLCPETQRRIKRKNERHFRDLLGVSAPLSAKAWGPYSETMARKPSDFAGEEKAVRIQAWRI
jgi:hypothetical protein